MTREPFFHTLEKIRDLHEASDALTGFFPFPNQDQLQWRPLPANPIGATRLFVDDKTLRGGDYPEILDAFVALADLADWRETYKDTNIGDDFLSRFGCFELLGKGGHFDCQTTRGFVVYSPPNLYYPWHHHPAEEVYFILAGEAEFATEGSPAKMLRPGDSVFHASNQPHNMTTRDKGVFAWVQWRGDLETAPVLTDRMNEVA